MEIRGNLNDSSGNDRTGAHSGTNVQENLSSTGKFGKGLFLMVAGIILPLLDIKELPAEMLAPCLHGSRQIRAMQVS